MKRWFFLSFILIALVMPGISPAQTWYPANQRTVAWDPITIDDQGQPLSAAATMAYEVYYKTTANSTPVLIAETTATQITVTFPVEASYFLGVKGIRKEGEVKVAESSIAWSDISANCQDNQAFGVRYFKNPGKAGGLRTPQASSN